MSNFIPMVSSSPPPMDDGGGFDWDDDDDEFGTFASASVTADTSQTIDPGDSNSFPSNNDSSNMEIGNDVHAEHINAPAREDNNFADFKPFSSSKNIDDGDDTTVDSVKLHADVVTDLTKTSGVWTSDSVSNEVNNEPMVSSLTDSGLYSAGISPLVHSSEHSESSSKSQGSDPETSSLTEVDTHNTPTEDIANVGDHEVCECSTIVSGDLTTVSPNSQQACHLETDSDSLTNNISCPNGEVIKHSDSDCNSSTVIVQSQDSHFHGSSNIPDDVCHSTDQVSEGHNKHIQYETSIREEPAPTCRSPVNIPDEESSSHSDQTDEDTFQSVETSFDTATKCECDSQHLEDDKYNSESTINDVTNCVRVMAADNVSELDSATIDDQSPHISDSLGTETCQLQQEITEPSEHFTGEDDTSDSVIPGGIEPNTDEEVKHNVDNVIVTETCEAVIEFGDFSAIERVTKNDHTTESVPLKPPTFDTEAEHADKVGSLEHSTPSHNITEPSNNRTYNDKQQDTHEDDIGDFGSCVPPDNDGQNEFSSFESITKDESNSGNCDSEDSIGHSKLPVERNNSGFVDIKSNSEHSDEDEFGEFDTSVCAEDKLDENKSDFGDFNTGVGAEDSFCSKSGFTAVDETTTTDTGGDWAAFSEPQLSVKAEDDADDGEWGEFDDDPVQETPKTDVKVEHSAAAETVSQNMSKQDKVHYVVSGCFTVSMSPEESEFVTFADTFSSADATKCESGDSVWAGMKGLQSTNALTYQWPQSKWNSQLFTTLHVDTRNILIGHKKTSVPIFASGLTLLEPMKGPMKSEMPGPAHTGETLVDTSKSDVQPALSQEGIPPAQFDWSTSGLTNPLEATNKTLNLDFLIQESEQATKSSALESEFLGASLRSPARKPTVQPLENILANLKSSSTFKPTNQHEDLSSEAKKVMELLPHLNFMSSKVLMFPLKLDD